MQIVPTSLLADLFVKTTLGSPKIKKVLMHNFYKIQSMYIICLFNNTLSSQLNKTVYSLTKKKYLLRIYLSYCVYINIPYIFTLLGNSKRHSIVSHRERFCYYQCNIFEHIGKLTKRIGFKSANLLSSMCKMCKI